MSNALLFLKAEDFHIIKNEKNQLLLCNNIKDLSLVLFYGKNCKHCQILLPIFKRLPGKIAGLFIGISMVSADLVKLSKESHTEIEYVPLMILYLNGVPVCKYESEYTEESIINFIMTVSKQLQKRDTFIKTNKGSMQQNLNIREQPMNGSRRHKNNVIPPYSLGHPLTEDQISYFEFNEIKGYISGI